ncbi:MAG: BtrH N-terminal domain-containing protein [Chloroflexi bacterium]|nr:BtrH N-terminal domain-containing protein [Chloroflexota bacterium]
MKLIELPHKVCGMTCMINGLEDLYEQKTGVRLPDWLLLHTSGLLGFVYIKNKNAPTPRMVFWGMQIAKYQYEALADVVGFTWQMAENRSFPFTLKGAKKSIDQGTPALLGALDMYHLPYYEKFYHNFHIPIHHVLMVGYDDAREVVLVLDCDRAEVQVIPYTNLELAWDVTIPGMGKKNTFYTFEFNGQVADVETIARKGLRKRATEMLAPPASMFGIKGMRKLVRELPRWSEQLDAKQFDISIRHLVEYTGFPPIPPNRLTGYDDAPDNHAGGRDVFAGLLRRLAREYDEPVWIEAATLFDQSGQVLVELTDMMVDYILGERNTLKPASELLTEIADLEERAFCAIRDA